MTIHTPMLRCTECPEYIPADVWEEESGMCVECSYIYYEEEEEK